VTEGREVLWDHAMRWVLARATISGDENLEVVWLFNDNADNSDDAPAGYWHEFEYVPNYDDETPALEMISRWNID
jgi:hypothetical protein